MTYTEPCVTDKYFTNRKFTEQSKHTYTRLDQRIIQSKLTGYRMLLERVVKFIVYEVDPDYGTNLEYYIDNRLQLSGYWTDKADFEATFENL